jgi:hyaluronan synthase
MKRMREVLPTRILTPALALAPSLLLALGLGRVEGVPASAAILASSLLFIFTWFSFRATRPPQREPGADDEGAGELFVSIVIPVFNEEPELLRRNLASIRHQSRPPDRVWIIDDGSSQNTCAHLAQQFAAEQQEGHQVDVRVVVKPRNEGKRRALVEAFRTDADAEVFFTVDSDTILDLHAISEGIAAFRDPQVFAIAGVLGGHNRDQNLLTKVVEMEFTGGFLLNRAAMSRVGTVLVTCGSLAAYRAEICRDHIDDLLNERFLGAPVSNGDDRKLTQFALRRGRVVTQESCLGKVALPQSLGHLLRQRLRWSTSFLRGTLFMLRTMPLNRLAFWLSLLHAGEFLAQAVILLGVVTYGAVVGWSNLALIATAILLPRTLLRHRRYWQSTLVDRSKVGPVEYFSLSALATLLSVVVLMPLRFLALLHLRSSHWRTRESVEVVTLAEDE